MSPRPSLGRFRLSRVPRGQPYRLGRLKRLPRWPAGTHAPTKQSRASCGDWRGQQKLTMREANLSKTRERGKLFSRKLLSIVNPVPVEQQ
jgi:hypothetical protein